jgi:hypothetical protein
MNVVGDTIISMDTGHPCMAAGVSDRLWTLEELVEQTSR